MTEQQTNVTPCSITPRGSPLFPRRCPNALISLSGHPGSPPSLNLPWAQPGPPHSLSQHSLGLQVLLPSHLPSTTVRSPLVPGAGRPARTTAWGEER